MLHGLPHSMALLLWVLVKDFREEEGGAEVLPFVLTEISTFSHHQSQQQKPCNRNRQKAPPQSMVVARMQV